VPLPSRVDRTLLAAGCLQLAALLAPAARVRIVGAIPFARVPSAGVALAILGALTIAVALRPRGWWRWVPGVLSAAILAVVYWRLTRAPSATFVDPVLRRALRVGWGFWPMGLAVLLGLVGAARVRGGRPAADIPS
jgi:hypothetical protein